MADTASKARATGSAAKYQKLDESDVLNLVLDYLATKGFVEAERTLRQSVSASDGNRKQSSNQQTGDKKVFILSCPTHIRNSK